MFTDSTTRSSLDIELVQLTPAFGRHARREAIPRLAEQARGEDSIHEQSLAARLGHGVAAHCGKLGVEVTKFPACESPVDLAPLTPPPSSEAKWHTWACSVSLPRGGG